MFPWQHSVLDTSTAQIAADPCFGHDAAKCENIKVVYV